MSKVRFGSDYLPLVESEGPRYRLVLSFSKVAWFTVFLPFVSFIFCIVWSIFYNFEKATETHCKVYNILPSVSAAIGHYRPQKSVWETAIACQAFVRIIVFYMYYKYYQETVQTKAKGMSNFALLSYLLENISLVTLSFWSSNENYLLHKISFIVFLVMSFLHMVTAYAIARTYRSVKDYHDNLSITWKRRALCSSFASILSACFFFYRHNTYCEPLIYSMFALSEYVVVISNMAFHVTAAFDFAGRSLMFSTKGLLRII